MSTSRNTNWPSVMTDLTSRFTKKMERKRLAWNGKTPVSMFHSQSILQIVANNRDSSFHHFKFSYALFLLWIKQKKILSFRHVFSSYILQIVANNRDSSFHHFIFSYALFLLWIKQKKFFLSDTFSAAIFFFTKTPLFKFTMTRSQRVIWLSAFTAVFVLWGHLAAPYNFC